MKNIHALPTDKPSKLYFWEDKLRIGDLTTAPIIPKEEPKQETLEQIDQNNPITRGSTALVYKQETFEEVAEKSVIEQMEAGNSAYILGFTKGAKWQQERSYSEEEALNLLTHFAVEIQRQNKRGQYPIEIKGWFERNKETFKKK
jgi:hypothetical protein